MKYVTVKLLHEMNACEEGIDEFCNEIKKRDLKRVSVDKCIQIAVEIGSEHVDWLLSELGKYLTDGFTCDWKKLDGRNWSYLLIKQPQFSIHCHWKKLSGYGWMWLLIHRPHFSTHCDWSKLSGYDWRWLLRYQPQFHEHCDWKKLSGFEWRCLLSHQPQFEKYKPVN